MDFPFEYVEVQVKVKVYFSSDHPFSIDKVFTNPFNILAISSIWPL